MNVVYLLGNGFDLNLGLKTSYTEFYKYYETVKTESSIVRDFKQNITANPENWSDLELALGKYSEKLSSPEQIDEVHEDILDKLAVHLENVQKIFLEEKLQNIDVEKFKSCLFHPENFLDGRDSASLRRFYGEHSGNQNVYNIITFNYTHLIEQILNKNTQLNHQNLNIRTTVAGKIHSIQTIQHLHGSLAEDMVLGVDSTKQISNEELSSYINVKETLIKKECNFAMGHGVELQCQKLINQSSLICIFGSSLGETDKTWWSLIADKLKDAKTRLIIFEYKSNFSKRTSQRKARFKREILKRFFSESDIENVKDRVYYCINSEMFNLFKNK